MINNILTFNYLQVHEYWCNWCLHTWNKYSLEVQCRLLWPWRCVLTSRGIGWEQNLTEQPWSVGLGQMYPQSLSCLVNKWTMCKYTHIHTWIWMASIGLNKRSSGQTSDGWHMIVLKVAQNQVLERSRITEPPPEWSKRSISSPFKQGHFMFHLQVTA